MSDATKLREALGALCDEWHQMADRAAAEADRRKGPGPDRVDQGEAVHRCAARYLLMAEAEARALLAAAPEAPEEGRAEREWAMDEAVKEYGLACRIAGKDAWLNHHAMYPDQSELAAHVKRAQERDAEVAVNDAMARIRSLSLAAPASPEPRPEYEWKRLNHGVFRAASPEPRPEPRDEAADIAAEAHGQGQESALRDAVRWLEENDYFTASRALAAEFKVAASPESEGERAVYRRDPYSVLCVNCGKVPGAHSPPTPAPMFCPSAPAPPPSPAPEAASEVCATHKEKWIEGTPCPKCGGERVWHSGMGSTTTDEHQKCLGTCGMERYVDGIDA